MEKRNLDFGHHSFLVDNANERRLLNKALPPSLLPMMSVKRFNSPIVLFFWIKDILRNSFKSIYHVHVKKV
ncbi:unnamed protein product [Oppiella nova]|uniref:Uncharacterized protein n=1 Tax=Oppiella nova TaxID=334625 RepID=A0A7R9QSZ0_9ACAR|nr:unnamed protein product [Oppiella nova]CAG2173786.1 unnamed protein product [Oppiella nova]